MVGLVLVSHSADLARAAAMLARQVGGPEISIATAGGVGENRSELGTDSMEILEAIESVFSTEGVLVLMDLGSAILSTEVALDFLDPARAGLVRLSAAPLVEGAVAAAVRIAGGATLEEAAEEAAAALSPKREQLGLPTASSDPVVPAPSSGSAGKPSESGTARTLRIAITGEHGLHARPAARLVRAVSRFDALVRVRNLTTGTGPADGRSLNGIATLGVRSGDLIEVEASGAEADAALHAIAELAEVLFGERTEPGAAAREVTGTSETPAAVGVREALRAAVPVGASVPVGVSEGIAIGPVFRFDSIETDVPHETVDRPETELVRFREAADRTRAAIDAHATVLRRRGVPDEAAIFDAHRAMLDDPILLEQVTRLIEEQAYGAAYAWWSAISAVADEYRALPDIYQKQRAADVLDVGRQVLSELSGTEPVDVLPDRPVIVAAREISPSQLLRLPADLVLGLITRTCGPTSHVAILARALGIPAITGYADAERLSTGTEAAMNADTGEVVIEPNKETKERFEALLTARERRERGRRTRAKRPASTTDGVRVELLANVGDIAGGRRAVDQGAEGVGLLRTEFLFLARTGAPNEEEQTTALREVIDSLDGRPVNVRTLDIGGDKNVLYLPQPAEDNPFLGVRGIRLCLREEAFFLVHIRAILRAAADRPVSVMIPMISSIEEVENVRKVLERAHRSLRSDGIPHRWPIPLGIMVETPAAVFLADRLAAVCEFFSIGTNDLTQYVMAAERGNEQLSALADPLHPAILNAIALTFRAADAAGIPCSVCGEMAGTREGAAVLIGLGCRRLSMNGGSIDRIKALIGSVSAADLKDAARRALEAADVGSVREALRVLPDDDNA